MNRTVAICIMVCALSAVVILTACAPVVLGDTNTFLLNFVNHEYLSFMGVLVTITLASAANIHIELNRYDELVGTASFERSRRDVQDSAFALIVALCLSLATVVVKPLGPAMPQWQSALNGFALLTIIFSIMVVVDITLAAFALRPPNPRRGSGTET